MTKNLYFRRSNGEYILLLESCTTEEAWTAAKEFMSNHKFTYYYVRKWNDSSGNQWWDVGSHTEFFVWGFIENS